MQDYDRLLYLKQCLEGPPLDLIDRYAIDDLGYQYVTEALEKRYFNPQQAPAALRKDLQDLRAPASTAVALIQRKRDQGDTSPWTIKQLMDMIHDALDIMNEVSTYDGATP
ncbi:hypothetical protein AAVH_42500 [Aphelenchoides avenae]|nr:hypothetical protein AAVH_42500 [Aphelenchus avenae]